MQETKAMKVLITVVVVVVVVVAMAAPQLIPAASDYVDVPPAKVQVVGR